MAKVILVNDDGTQEEFEHFLLHGFDDEKEECTEVVNDITMKQLVFSGDAVAAKIRKEMLAELMKYESEEE